MAVYRVNVVNTVTRKFFGTEMIKSRPPRWRSHTLLIVTVVDNIEW